MQKTFDFISDPGHGWVKVPIKLLWELGIAEKITTYSYQRGEYAYLEEDGDATLFHRAFFDRYHRFPVYRERNAGQKYSRVRGYRSYEITKLPEGFKLHIPGLIAMR